MMKPSKTSCGWEKGSWMIGNAINLNSIGVTVIIIIIIIIIVTIIIT